MGIVSKYFQQYKKNAVKINQPLPKILSFNIWLIFRDGLPHKWS